MSEDLLEYEVKFEYFDYVFTKKHQIKYDYFLAKSAEEAKNRCRFIHGDLIDILSVEVFY